MNVPDVLAVKMTVKIGGTINLGTLYSKHSGVGPNAVSSYLIMGCGIIGSREVLSSKE